MGAIGAKFMLDLNVFLLGMITSILVERLMISGATTGLGRAESRVPCNSLIINSFLCSFNQISIMSALQVQVP